MPSHPISDLISFTTEEKVNYLRSCGYSVEEVVVTMYFSVYHGDVEESDVKVWKVTDSGNDFKRPSTRNFGQSEWLDAAFESVMRERLKFILLRGDISQGA